MTKILFDLDDMTTEDENNCITGLMRMKKKYPHLKVTLFTILGKCNHDELRELMKIDWIEFAAHGFTHITNQEVLEWDLKKWKEVLWEYKTMGFTRVFKAPNWEMSPLGYEVLNTLGWGVAVRRSQIGDLPKGIKYYGFEEEEGTHGHTWLLKAHEKEDMFKKWNRDSEFDFISSHLRIK